MILFTCTMKHRRIVMLLSNNITRNTCNNLQNPWEIYSSLRVNILPNHPRFGSITVKNLTHSTLVPMLISKI